MTTSDAKHQEFEDEIAAVRIRTGTAEAEQRWTRLGLAGMVGGPVLCFIAFMVSGGQTDERDVISSAILGLFGLSLTVLGAALFLRYSLARFLRFWLLRLIYEQRAQEGSSPAAASKTSSF